MPRSFTEKVAEQARNAGGDRDLGGRGFMRRALTAPPEVWEKIKKRFPEIEHDQDAFMKWFNSSASEYYNRFKTRERI